MRNLDCRTDLPILMVYDVDPAWSQDSILERLEEAQRMIDAMKAIGHPMTSARLEKANLSEILQQHDPDETIVLNWCEDIPGLPHSCAMAAQELEQLGFTFTGSDSVALTICQDKRKIKNRLENSGIPTPTWKVFTSSQPCTWNRFPGIVKPAFEHFGKGITRESVVQTTTELIHRLSFVLGEYHQPAIVEDFIDGREFHVGIIGNGKLLQALPPGEIDYLGFSDIHDRLCTYESNFDKDSLAYQLTLPRMSCVLSKTELGMLDDIVRQAYLVTNCRDYARMDIRLQDGIFYVLDVNHNADISSETSLVLGAKKIGYSYGQFGSLLVNLAAQRHQISVKKNRHNQIVCVKGSL